MEITTKQLAERIGYTPQAINKVIRKVCKERQIDPKTFGRLKEDDKRLRVFNDAEVALILKHCNKSETDSETLEPVLEPVLEPFETDSHIPSSLAVRQSQPLTTFSIQNLNLNLVIQNNSGLETEVSRFQEATGQALQVLKLHTTMQLKNSIQEMQAQNSHAISGIQAASLIDAVRESINAPSDTAIHQQSSEQK